MKKAFFMTFAFILMFAGCNKNDSQSGASVLDSPPPPSSSVASDNKKSGPAVKSPDPTTPDGAAEILLEKITNLDEAQLKELAAQYISTEQIPDTYFSLLKPISERISYKIGSYRIQGNKAMVDIAVTSVDVKSAINSVMPGAVAHLATLQLAGKDISNPEKILAEYAAKNIDWDSLPTIKTDTTLYLVMGADGEWKIDLSAPENMHFANAISGGAIEVAQSLKDYSERFK